MLLVLGIAAGCGGEGVEAGEAGNDPGRTSGFARVGAPAERPQPIEPMEEVLSHASAPPASVPDRPLGSPASGVAGVGVAGAGAEQAPASPAEAPSSSPAASHTGLEATSLSSPAGATTLAAREARVEALLREDRPGEAARALSGWILDGLVASGGGEDVDALARYAELVRVVQAQHRWRAQGAWPAVEATVLPGEGLITLRKRVLEEHPDLRICTGLIARANQLAHPEALQPGDVLRIPTEKASVRVDLSARWAFYCFGDEVADAWPVGIGKPGQETPPGEYTVGIKQSRPPWHPRGRAMVPYGDPENPLGSHWVGWMDENGRPTDVGFHGTSDEAGVGGEVSLGCLRMRNADVEVLHDVLPQGSAVHVQP